MSFQTNPTVFPMFIGRRSTQKFDDGALTPLQLIRLKIEQQVNGDFPLIHQIAVTMTFKNTHHIVLEGAFEFTLPEKATICNYGLDVDNEIVDGVVVEKERARVAFETEARKRIDPGLVELVTGNIFRTRVYPIEPQKTRTVRVIYQDQASRNNDSYLYQIPVQYETQLESLDIVLTCSNQNHNIRPQLLTNTNPILNNSVQCTTRDNGEFIAEWHLTNVKPIVGENQLISYVLPAIEKSVLTAIEIYPNESAYFAVSCVLPKSTEQRIYNQNEFSPKTICILWDASLSRSNSKENRLIELNALKTIFNHWLISRNRLDIIIQPFRYQFDDLISFQLQTTNWNEFLKIFEDLLYDGATDLSIISTLKSTQTIDIFFLCSDCISTINQQSFDDNNFQAPIWIFNGNYLHESFDNDIIRYLTQYNPYGGGYFNRDRLQSNANDLISSIQTTQIKYMKIYSNELVQQIYPSKSIIIPLNSDRFLLVGRISLPLPESIEFQLEFSLNNQTAHVPIKLDKQKNFFGLIRRLWAQEKLNELNMFKEKNKSEILSIGLEYSIVSQFTSLLVLETLQQHIKYGICPAQSRTSLYRNYLQYETNKTQQKTNNFSQLLSQWTDKCNWFNGNTKPFGLTSAFGSSQLSTSVFGAPTSSTSFSFGSSTTTSIPTSSTGFSFGSSTGFSFGSSTTTSIPTSSTGFSFGSSTTTSVVPTSSAGFSFGSSTTNPAPGPTSTIILPGYTSNLIFTNRLSPAMNFSSAYLVYLSERENHRQSPSFYFDIASYFLSRNSFSSTIDQFNRNQTNIQPPSIDTKAFEYGLRILTNILELQYEIPQFYRTVAFKLIELKQWNLALDVCRKIHILRSNEPESLYNLALIHIELKQYDQAIEYFKKILTNQWDNTLSSIHRIVLSDYNRLIHQTKQTSIDIDQRFLRHLPVDIRIVVQWDTSDVSIHLNITQPNNNLPKDIFSNSRFISFQTNSPNEYLIRRAVNGTYSISVTLTNNAQQRLTGATTVLIYIYKYFGMDMEEKQMKTVRLTSLNETIHVGEIIFENINEENRPQSTIQHLNCTCDGCSKTPIIGDRYRCLFCLNLDFCQTCHDYPPVTHDSQHPFICIRDSTVYNSSIYLQDMNAIKHDKIQCQICSASPIMGIRYQCIQCQIDICGKCEFNCLHDLSHQRLKIIFPPQT